MSNFSEPTVVSLPLTSDFNKGIAVKLLAATDWVNQPDVYQGQAPTLTNRDAFLAYRQQLRQIAVNPPAGDVSWPKKPSEQWSA